MKPEFFKHEDLFKAERKSKLPLRVAFAGLWTVADREGRFRWKPAELKTDVLPHDKVDFTKVLEALVEYGFIERYKNEGKEYGYIPSWHDHQRIRPDEAKSQIPEPPLRTRVNPSEPETIRIVEGKGKEEKGKEDEPPPPKRINGFNKDDYYSGGQEAFAEIIGDDLMMERLLRVVRSSGFQGCQMEVVAKSVKHFFTVEEAKPEFYNKPRDDIKSHLVNWIRKNAKTLNQYG